MSLFRITLFLVFFSINSHAVDLAKDKAEFFNHDAIYYILIQDWGTDWNHRTLGQGAKSHDEYIAKRKAYRNFNGSTLWIFSGPTSTPEGTPCPSAKQMIAQKRTLHFVKNENENPAFFLGIKGNTSFEDPKANFKLKFTKGNRLFGMNRLNLHAMYRDVSQMREYFAYSLFNKLGVLAPRHAYVRFCIQRKGQNKQYMGLYSLIENIDEDFLKDRFSKQERKGNLYEANYTHGNRAADLTYLRDHKYYDKDRKRNSYELETNKSDNSKNTGLDLSILIDHLEGRNRPGSRIDRRTKEYFDFVSEVFDVDSFASFAALNYGGLGAWDNYWVTPGNYSLYNAGTMLHPKFKWIAYDYDSCFGTGWTGTDWHYKNVFDIQSSHHLAAIHNLLQNPYFRKLYQEKLQQMVESVYQLEWFTKRKNKALALISDAAMDEGFFSDRSSTGRWFTNDEVYRAGFEFGKDSKERYIEKPHPKNPSAKIRSMAITDFVRERRKTTQKQISE